MSVTKKPDLSDPILRAKLASSRVLLSAALLDSP